MRFLAENLAKVVHEANRAYCEITGDHSQVPWEQAPDWQKKSAIDGVEKILNGEIKSPEQSHESWMKEKLDTGWSYGSTKDAEAKTHPAMLPYEELPVEQRLKDALFFAIIHALLPGV